MNCTKGEWTLLKGLDGLTEFPAGHHQIVGDGQRSNVAIIPIHWNNAEANAQLIASAPRMHQAILEAISLIKPYTKGYDKLNLANQAYDKLRAALAKVEK